MISLNINHLPNVYLKLFFSPKIVFFLKIYFFFFPQNFLPFAKNNIISIYRSILNELENQETQQKFKDNKLLVDIKDYLMYTGSYEPLEQIFVLCKNSHNVALFFFLLIIAHITRLQFSLQTQSLIAKTPKDQMDGTPLLMGLITILQQYHKDVKIMLITYLCQYVKLLVESNLR